MTICPACGKPSLRFFPRQGKYRCTDTDCGEEFTPEDLQTVEIPPPVEPDLLAALPFPVAFPLAHVHDSRLSARDRVANAIFAGYQAMRTTALLLLADYLACDTVCRQLQGPIRGLRLPHWGEWALLCDTLAKFWSGRLQERPEREPHFPRLAAAWLEVNRRGKLPKGHLWTQLLADLPGLQGPAAQSPNDALWKARNVRAHREATRTVEEGDDLAHLPRLVAVAETIAQRLFPPNELTLWRRLGSCDDPLGVIRLHGPHLDLCFPLDDSPEAAALHWGSTGLLVSTPSADLPVYPLFVPLDVEGAGQSLPGGGLIDPVGLVDGISETKIAVLGVRGHFELPELAGPVQAALTRKEVQLGFDRVQTKRWSLVSWARVTAEDTLNALRGRKYLPDVYLERAGVDGRAHAVLDRPGRGLLLLGEAGAGKSSLLARLVDHLLADTNDDREPVIGTQTWLARRGSGDLVLFLSGAEAYQGDAAWSGRQLLCEAVLRRAGIASGTFTDLDDLCRHLQATAGEDQEAGRCVWLIFDALNEAARFTDLLKALDDLLPALERYPWLRLVVSLRSGAYQALAQRHRDLLQHGHEVLANARYLASFTDARDREVPYLELRPFTAGEAATAYALRQDHRPDQSCPQPYDRLPPTLRQLLRAPLYLHLFHETFRGRTDQPQDLDEGRLLGAYLDRLEADLPGIAGYLQRLGRLMYERRIPILPVAEADVWVTEWRARLGADNALRLVKLDPVEELVAASLLMRPAEQGEGAERRLMGYGFTQQRLCEQVLLRELRRRMYPRTHPTAAELLAWARQADGPAPGEDDSFQELTGALETLTAELAQAGAGEVLAVLLDLEGEPVRTRLLASALQALGPLGRAAPATLDGVIQPLVARAITATPLGERWIASVWQAQRWLTDYGFSLVAGQLGQGRLQVMRSLVAQEPGRADLRRDLAVSLNDLGRLAENAGDRAGAQGYFEESLEILRALVAQKPGRTDLRRDLSASLIDLGQLASNEGDGAGARGYFEESLEILRALVAQEPGRTDLRRELSASLSSLGRLAENAGDGVGARRYFEESLEISRALVAQEPGRTDLWKNLSVSLNDLGRLAENAGDGAGARGYFEESLEILRALVAQEPGRTDLRRELSASLTGLGQLASNEGDGVGARGYFEESLEILRALVVQEPGRTDLRRDLSASLSSLGRLAENAGDGGGARGYFEEDMEISRALVAQEPGRTDLWKNLSASLNDLGRLAENAGDGAGARGYFEESLAIMRALVAQEPGRTDLRRELSSSLIGLGQLASNEGDGVDARGYCEESLEIMRALVVQEPGRTDLRRGLSASLSSLGRLAENAGDGVGARGYFEESLEISRALVVQEPGRTDLRRDLSVSLNDLGRLAENAGDGAGAQGYFEESLEILRALVAQEPGCTDLRRGLSASLSSLGRLAENAGDGVGARGYFEEDLEISRALVAQEPGRTDLWKNLSASLNDLGRLAENAGDGAGARGYVEESLEIMRALVAQGPGRAELRRDLSVLLSSLGRLAENAGDGAGAQGYFEESLEILRALVAQEPGRTDLRRDLSVLLNNLGRLAENAGGGTGAQGYVEESLEILRTLVAQEPGRTDLWKDLSASLNDLGRLAENAGDGAGARGCFEEDLEISRALVAQEPGRADLRRNLVIAYWHQHLISERKDQRKWLRLLLDTMLPLLDQGPLHGQLGDLWELATKVARARGIEPRVLTEFDHGTRQPLLRGGGVKIGRNEPCPCGSGKKFKRCHGNGIHMRQ